MHLANWSKILSFPTNGSKTLQNKQVPPSEQTTLTPSVNHTYCETVNQPIKASIGENTFSPNRHLLGLIQATLREGVARKYALQGCADIIVIADKKLYYSSSKLQDLKLFFETPAKNIKVSLLDIKKLDNIIDQLIAKSQPIDDLLWCAAQYGSKGRLLKSVDPNTITRLKYWPDIAHLPDYKQYLPLAAFLNSNAADLMTVVEQTNSPLAVVNNFYNACITLGLLEKAPKALIQDKPDNTLDHALYENISATLGGISVTDKQRK